MVSHIYAWTYISRANEAVVTTVGKEKKMTINLTKEEKEKKIEAHGSCVQQLSKERFYKLLFFL